MQAQNDPFIPADVIPQADEVSALVQLDITSQGGHVGFVAGSRPWRPIYWLEQRIPSFLAVHLGQHMPSASESEAHQLDLRA